MENIKFQAQASPNHKTCTKKRSRASFFQESTSISMARSKILRNPFISLIHPSHLLRSFSLSLSLSTPTSLLLSSKKHHKQPSKPAAYKLFLFIRFLSLLFIFLLFFFSFFEISTIRFQPAISPQSFRCPSSPPSSSFTSSSLLSRTLLKDARPALCDAGMGPLPIREYHENITAEEREFWRQPDACGYRPCLEFSLGYRKASARIAREKRRFLMVVVTGGLNQQRNEIVDAVVIARILEAVLVIPILKVNQIWDDDSEFSDIFDAEHFKKTLQSDVRIVSSLPSTHLNSRPTDENRIPLNLSPLWIRTKFFKLLNEEGVLLLRGLDSKLSKDLPLDLQKLRCKVAFHALRFVKPISELGNLLATRMWEQGPYIALHLRLEKDVWVRTGCLPGLGPKFDYLIAIERELRPDLLTGRLNMSYNSRKMAGLCPLTGQEVARLLKALGAPGSARVYVAGGEPLGGSEALRPLKEEFPNMITKEMLAIDGELEAFANRSSALAAVDYMVSLTSDVFMPSHGGNMGRAIQGHRTYWGQRKFIKPNKRSMLPLLGDKSVMSEGELKGVMKHLHKASVGQPEARTKKRGRDVIAYPVPECMCPSHPFPLLF